MQKEPSILVVDDEHNLRCTLTLILEKAGYQVTAADSCASAQQALRQQSFDLVFLDLHMPDGEGLVLLSDLRREHENLPVLILTAHASLDTAIGALRLGAKDYLLKPVDPAQILNRVDQILGENKKPQQRRALLSRLQTLLQEIGREEGSLARSDNSAPGFESSEQPPPLQTQDQPSLPPVGGERYLMCGQFQLDLQTRRLLHESQVIPLTPTAFDYLHTLMCHSPHTVPFEDLVAESQGFSVERIDAQEIARWRIHELRKAIETNTRQPIHIITVRGEGYRFLS
jgi:DNA-binding response OmpR family regulator